MKNAVVFLNDLNFKACRCFHRLNNPAVVVLIEPQVVEVFRVLRHALEFQGQPVLLPLGEEPDECPDTQRHDTA